MNSPRVDDCGALKKRMYGYISWGGVSRHFEQGGAASFLWHLPVIRLWTGVPLNAHRYFAVSSTQAFIPEV
jgi:hypothetical protein